MFKMASHYNLIGRVLRCGAISRCDPFRPRRNRLHLGSCHGRVANILSRKTISTSISHGCGNNQTNNSTNPHRIRKRNTSNFQQYFRHWSSTAKVTDSPNYGKGVIHDENQLEYLPEGITRQTDFFGEGLTFIKNLNRGYIPTNDQSTENHLQMPNSSNPHSSHPSNSIQPQSTSHANLSDAISSFDNMSLCIISKGSANIHNGNDGEGPQLRAMHASAMAWADLLTHSYEWNCGGEWSNPLGGVTAAPMLAVVAVAPVVAQGGIHYLHRIDALLASSSSSSSLAENRRNATSLLDMARYATSFRDVFVSSRVDSVCSVNDTDRSTLGTTVPILSPRERWHLHALHQLLQNNHRAAMGAYLRLLELFPGDLLALSLAMDVAYTLGDADLALRAATHVSTYWTERDGGRLNHSHPGQTMATSLLAVGLASSSSSRASTAERLAETALSRDSDSSGGTAVWALSHSLAGEGRSQEMLSRLSTSDGVQLYEAAGYLAFNKRMSGYGAIAILDTQRSGADRSAIRMYDGSFGHVLQYSGNNVEGIERGGEKLCLGELKVPRSIKDDVRGTVGSMFSNWFGRGGGTNPGSRSNDDETNATHDESATRGKIHVQKRSPEAVLTWLPPSPILLTQATALLLRMTLCDAIPSSDHRWADLRAAWEVTLENGNDLLNGEQTSVEFMPLALLAASLMIEPTKLHVKPISPQLEMAMGGLHQLGNIMKLGQLKVQMKSSSYDDIAQSEKWRAVLTSLSRARDTSRWEMPSGISSATYLPPSSSDHLDPTFGVGWEFDTRQFLEYSLCHAAMEVGDYESLCLAKTLCSEGTTLRSNCPEVWWRYAMIMEKLGDDVAAENARAASVSLGGSEGSAAL
ncbi:hypothetical protein HJC23_010604 [Cyclotella cryptica]|uniref:Tetratricopeptide repeat protein 38 n=1 Tax=Cyclotella cryptica TaxID=29204 RepID=A0ABD3PQE4_9STRA|eukprot:CCRYP_012813-RA/>CCRYP_012813-RA protein AED:0.01 eAED:0.01 QI:505/1/1/1/1/1/2/279/863